MCPFDKMSPLLSAYLAAPHQDMEFFARDLQIGILQTVQLQQGEDV